MYSFIYLYIILYIYADLIHFAFNGFSCFQFCICKFLVILPRIDKVETNQFKNKQRHRNSNTLRSTKRNVKLVREIDPLSRDPSTFACLLLLFF